MLENFDDEAEKPVSAAFGAPFETNNDNREQNYMKEVESDEEFSPTRSDSPYRNDSSPTRFSEIENTETAIIDTISQNAINEMISQIFDSVGKTEELNFEDFKKAVAIDVNIMAWFESLGSVF